MLGKALEGQARQGADLDQVGTFRRRRAERCGLLALPSAARAGGSLRRLGTDYVDIYHLHGFDALTPIEEVQDTLNKFVREGKVRYIACSNFSGWHLMKSLAVADRYGWTRFVAHQVYYSLIGREYEWELMPLGLDQKVGALVWSPLGWGRLTGKIRRGQPLPEVSRLHKTADIRLGPQVTVPTNTSTRWWMRWTSSGGRDLGQDGSAGGAELAAAAAHGFVGDYRRAQRGAVAAEPGRGGLDLTAEQVVCAGQGQRLTTLCDEPSEFIPTGTSGQTRVFCRRVERKLGPAERESAAGVALLPEGKLQALLNNDAVKHGLSSKDAGFARVVVLPELAESIQHSRCRNKAVYHRVRSVDARLVEAWILGNDLRHDVVIGAEGRAGGGSERDEPFEVARTQAHRAGPDGCLIVEEIARQIADRNFVLRRRLRRWGIGK
jgi:hypothetical protein